MSSRAEPPVTSVRLEEPEPVADDRSVAHRQDAMLGAIGFAAAHIVATGDWLGGIQNILDRLGKAADVSRAVLFELHPGSDGKLAESCRFDWAAPGFLKLSGDPRYQGMSLVDRKGRIDKWTQARQRGEVVQASLRDLDDENRRVFEEQGVKSFVSVPITLHTGLWGFLGFDECRAERVWTDAEIDALTAAAGLIAGAIERSKADEALSASEKRTRAVLETALDAIVTIDEKGDIVEFNPAASRIFGYSREAAIGKNLGDLLVPPVYRPLHEAGMRRFLQTGQSSILGKVVEVEALCADGSIIPIEVSLADVRLPGGHLFTAVLRDLRERRLFEMRLAESERQKGQLARHFSPNMVDALIQSGGALGAPRTQKIAVLFADLMGFTAIAATMEGPDVIGLLREFHERVERSVFDNHGTLDKYIGDGVMATFGTPQTGPRDAANAIACARQLVQSINQWNEERAHSGRTRVAIGIGVHYGSATLGNVGTDRRLEFTVVGDTVNIASRIEQLTRNLGPAIVVSDDAVVAAMAEGAADLTKDFTDLGIHPLRGTGVKQRLWGLTANALSDALPQSGT